jgi:hypothetical protein
MSRKTKILIIVSGTAVLALALGAVAIVPTHPMTARQAVIENMRKIDEARAQWEREQAATTNSPATNRTARTH